MCASFRFYQYNLLYIEHNKHDESIRDIIVHMPIDASFSMLSLVANFPTCSQADKWGPHTIQMLAVQQKLE